jgi:polyphosphate kinase
MVILRLAWRLAEAAEAGKQVLAVDSRPVDELYRAMGRKLQEDAGVHVVYGLIGFKTHTSCRSSSAKNRTVSVAMFAYRYRQLQS